MASTAILTVLDTSGTVTPWTTSRASTAWRCSPSSALADLTVNVETILGYFEEDDEDETEEEDPDA